MSGALLHMTPSLSSQDAVNLRLPHAKALGDLMLAEYSRKRAYFYNLFFGELRASMLGAFARYTQAIRVSVNPIFRARHPFKIVNTIVRLVAVNVVDLMAGGWRRANECLRNQSVDEFRVVLPTIVKGGPNIPAAIISRGENDGFTLNRANKTAIGHFIRSFMSKNWSPCFHYFTTITIDTLRCNMGVFTSQQPTQGELQ